MKQAVMMGDPSLIYSPKPVIVNQTARIQFWKKNTFNLVALIFIDFLSITTQPGNFLFSRDECVHILNGQKGVIITSEYFTQFLMNFYQVEYSALMRT